MTVTVLAAALALAFVNGANDNLKGVATLYGSGHLDFKRARWLATLSTGLGALLSALFASALVRAFSGKGLVPESVLTPHFLSAVGLGAAATVGLATWRKMPISTTHALVGALCGGGLAAAGAGVSFTPLTRGFLVPLLVGPGIALVGAWVFARSGEAISRRLGFRAQTCVCIEGNWVAISTAAPISAPVTAATSVLSPRLVIDETSACRERYEGTLAGVDVESAVSATHLVSASLVGFARGLNDTPKILGLLVGAGWSSLHWGAAAIAAAMALGGWWASRGVAHTLGKRITEIRPAAGMVGNLVTSFLVVAASRWGLPVSTTHVATGAIVGVGASAGALRRDTVGQIASAWVLTLPTAALATALLWWMLGVLS